VASQLRKRFVVTGVAGGIVLATALWLTSCSPRIVDQYSEVAREPDLSPDYSRTVIPPNIAPLNLQVREEGRAYLLKVHSQRGKPVTAFSKMGQMRLPARPWRKLLNANRGCELRFDVYVQGQDRQWRRFLPVTNTIAQEDIDGTLVFRLMKPLYNWWKDIGIYQRNLAGFDTSVVLHGRSFGEGCLNCHSFAYNDADTFSISLRSATYGSHTLVARDGNIDKVGAKWGYTAWHPSGRVAVYSINKVIQFFRAGAMEVRDVADLDSALACYDVASRTTTAPSELADKDRLETYPAWSPDGKFLYYCSAPILWEDRNKVPPDNYENLKYDLLRIAYDIETGQWGQAETVLSAEETGLSILLPRVSPDGRFLLFCMCDYGCFPVYQPGSNLYIMDLATRRYRKLAINSEFSESWHSWSSNSRWIAFSSKRQGGLFTRTYLSYIDEAGTAHKPFVVPQKDPATYDSLLETYSTPELITGPVNARKWRLAQAARGEPSITTDIPITGASPKTVPSDPWLERE
jgi:hypothetical protein